MKLWEVFLSLFNKKKTRECVNKISLHIGINDYPGTSNDLQGCVNDANNWKNLLRTVYGFKTCTTLLNSQATYSNVVKGMNKIISEANENTHVVITYSGHGSNVKNLDGTEADGRDECLCLYDKFLIDNDINVILNKLSPKARLTFISDSCHSGTITRSFLSTLYGEDVPKPRYLPPEDEEEILDIVPRSVEKKVENLNHVLIAGCQDHQFSFDAKIDGTFQGAMSANAISILKSNPDCTYEEFSSILNGKLPSRKYPQNPQVTIGFKYKKTKVFS